MVVAVENKPTITGCQGFLRHGQVRPAGVPGRARADNNGVPIEPPTALATTAPTTRPWTAR
eukprot:4539590-Pyramimonas_sp.AAC.1